MALTGIFLRRNTKANLIIDPPLVGEIVFATDTLEYGVVHANVLIWKNLFIDLPDLLRFANIAVRDSYNAQLNDFCIVLDTHKTYIFSSTWQEITNINDNIVSANTTWSSQKITDTINGIVVAGGVSTDALTLGGHLPEYFAPINAPTFTGTPVINTRGNIITDSDILNAGYF